MTLSNQTETIELPSFPGSKVEIKAKPLTGDLRTLGKKYPEATDPKSNDAQEYGMALILIMIVSWNFTDDDDKPLPIEEKYIDQLPAADFKLLTNKVMESVDPSQIGEEKKN